MRRSSRAAAVTGAAVVLPSAARRAAGEKSLSQSPAPAFQASALRVFAPTPVTDGLTLTVPSDDSRGPAHLSTDRQRSRSCATPGKDCQ